MELFYLSEVSFEIGIQVSEEELHWEPSHVVGDIKNTAMTYSEAYNYEVPPHVKNENQNLKSLKLEDKKITKKLDLNIEKPVTLEGKTGTVQMTKLKAIAKEMAENWNIPTCIISFLSNSLDQH